MREDFGALWALSPSSQRRTPTPSEIAGGFPCGPFDIDLFNEMMFALSSVLAEANGVLDAAGIVANSTNSTQLAAAIQALIAAGGGGGGGGGGSVGPLSYFRLRQPSTTLPSGVTTTFSNFSVSDVTCASSVSASTGIVTIAAGEAGLWLFEANGATGTASNGSTNDPQTEVCSIQINGVTHANEGATANSGSAFLDRGMKVLARVAAGDVIKAAYRQDSLTGSSNVFTTDAWNHFSGVRLGALS